jgi:hypothetical protein
MGYTFRPLLPKTIDAALLNLRAQIVRDGGDGLGHVEALMRLRRCHTERVPAKVPRAFKSGELRRAILAELRSGPLTAWELAERVAARKDRLTAQRVHMSVRVALTALKRRGLVRNGGGAWWVGNQRIPSKLRCKNGQGGPS